MQSSIRMDRNVPMEMRDGIILRADIFRLDDAQKHPAVLFRTPYDKALTGNEAYEYVITMGNTS
jgi:predicted acyl esterase